MLPRHLVVGATGKTGRLVVRQLLDHGHAVRVIVRSPERLDDDVRRHPQLDCITAPLLELPDADLAEAVRDCTAIASCLGHTLSLRGMFGPPWRLCTQAVDRLLAAARATHVADQPPTRFVLMSTVGVRDPRLQESRSLPEHVIFGLLRVLLPPQADNEQAAKALRAGAAPDDMAVVWAAVRPTTLVDQPAAGPTIASERLTESPLFGSGRISRLGVARFMAELMTDDAAWERWRGRMPALAADATDATDAADATDATDAATSTVPTTRSASAGR